MVMAEDFKYPVMVPVQEDELKKKVEHLRNQWFRSKEREKDAQFKVESEKKEQLALGQEMSELLNPILQRL